MHVLRLLCGARQIGDTFFGAPTTFQTIPLLNFHLKRLALTASVPDFIGAYIENWTSLSEARTREQFREIGRIINTLQRAGIDHFLLKGVALASTTYHDPLLRPMQDLDIMIYPREAWRVQRTIYRLGYKHGVFNPQDGRFTALFRRITPRSLRKKHAIDSVTRIIRVQSPIPGRLIQPGWRNRQIKSFVYDDGTIAIPIFVDFHINLFAGMELSDVWRGAQVSLHLTKLQ
jgi:Uncharacterised nucleotidyltransferase